MMHNLLCFNSEKHFLTLKKMKQFKLTSCNCTHATGMQWLSAEHYSLHCASDHNSLSVMSSE